MQSNYRQNKKRNRLLTFCHYLEADTVENPPQTPIDEDPHAEDPNEATSGAFQPPMSPFDLEAHFQNLNEMAKSPGFTFSCRPMFSGEDENVSRAIFFPSKSTKHNSSNSLKGTGHYWLLLKILVSIKTYLVTSNGELLIVWNIVRNGYLWMNLVFEKEVISHSNIRVHA